MTSKKYPPTVTASTASPKKILSDLFPRKSSLNSRHSGVINGTNNQQDIEPERSDIMKTLRNITVLSVALLALAALNSTASAQPIKKFVGPDVKILPKGQPIVPKVQLPQDLKKGGVQNQKKMMLIQPGPGPYPMPNNFGMLVTGTVPGMPAFGILEYGDIIVSINNQPTPNAFSFQNAIQFSGPHMNLLVRDVRTGLLRNVHLHVFNFPRRIGVYATQTTLPPVVYGQPGF